MNCAKEGGIEMFNVALLKPGDCFCTRNPMMLGRAINAVQKFWSKDNESTYSHSGFMINSGESFEALWTNKRQAFYKAYKGRKVLIARHKGMNPGRLMEGWIGVQKHEGKFYAGHRLFLFILPCMAKISAFGLGVCSELTMKFLYKAGLSGTWAGWNPDDVADMLRRGKAWDVIFEGKLT